MLARENLALAMAKAAEKAAADAALAAVKADAAAALAAVKADAAAALAAATAEKEAVAAALAAATAEKEAVAAAVAAANADAEAAAAAAVAAAKVEYESNGVKFRATQAEHHPTMWVDLTCVAIDAKTFRGFDQSNPFNGLRVSTPRSNGFFLTKDGRIDTSKVSPCHSIEYHTTMSTLYTKIFGYKVLPHDKCLIVWEASAVAFYTKRSWYGKRRTNGQNRSRPNGQNRSRPEEPTVNDAISAAMDTAKSAAGGGGASHAKRANPAAKPAAKPSAKPATKPKRDTVSCPEEIGAGGGGDWGKRPGIGKNSAKTKKLNGFVSEPDYLDGYADVPSGIIPSKDKVPHEDWHADEDLGFDPAEQAAEPAKKPAEQAAEAPNVIAGGGDDADA